MLVSPELMQVLGAAGAAARSLELTGDADVWSVMSGEIRNYHLHWGGPLSAAVLPDEHRRVPSVAVDVRVFSACRGAVRAGRALRGTGGRQTADDPSAIARHGDARLEAPRGDVRTRSSVARAGRDRDRPADFRSRVEQSRVLPSQKHAGRDDRGDAARHLFRSTSRPPCRRAHDSHPECARGVGLHRSDRGNPHRGRRDAVVAPRGSGPFSVGCRDQRGRRDRIWDCLHADTGRSPVPDGARTGRARRARTLSAVSERAAAYSAVGICCSGADGAAHSAHRARDLR